MSKQPWPESSRLSCVECIGAVGVSQTYLWHQSPHGTPGWGVADVWPEIIDWVILQRRPCHMPCSTEDALGISCSHMVGHWLYTVMWLVVTKVRSESFGLAKALGWLQSAVTKSDVLCAVSHIFAYWMSLSGIVCFLCAMHVFKVRASSSPLGYICAKLHFFHSLHWWASPWRKIVYLITHSVSHPPSLFDASGTEAFASE